MRRLTSPLVLCLMLAGLMLPALALADLLTPTDAAALNAAIESKAQVSVQGEVKSAEWSDSGKVMRIIFQKTAEDGLQVVLFEKQRKQFDAAFAGDFVKAISGKTLRIRGQVQLYGGNVPDQKGQPEIILRYVSQVTIVE